MSRSRVVLSIGLVALAAVTAGCGGANPLSTPAATSGSTMASPQPPTVPDPVQDVANESIHYKCEGGFEVVVAGDTARVATSDGRGASLARSTSAESMEFTGEAMVFSVVEEQALLVQDGGGRFPCSGVD